MASGRAKRAARRTRATTHRLRNTARNSSAARRSPLERAHQDLKDAVRQAGPIAISEDTIGEIKELLTEHRNTLKTISSAKFNDSAAIRDILQLLNGERDLYSRLSAGAFGVVLQLLLVNEDSKDTERGAFLAALSLYDDDHRDNGIKLKTIGRMLDILVKHFSNPNGNFRVRNWLGLLLLEVHNQCEENHSKFQDLTEDVRRKLGSMIADERNDLLKITCGKLISVMKSAGCALQHLWPVGAERKLWAEFPTEVLDENWNEKFQEYLDDNHFPSVPSIGRTYWVQDIKTAPPIIDGKISRILIFFDITSLTIHIFGMDNFDQELEVPISSIDTVTLQSTAQEDTRSTIQTKDLDIIFANEICYFNAIPVNLERIHMTVHEGADELMDDIELLLNPWKDRESGSNDELATSSLNESYKISQPESPVAPQTVALAKPKAAYTNERHLGEPLCSAAMESNNCQSSSNIHHGLVYATIVSPIMARSGSVRESPVNDESGDLSEPTPPVIIPSQDESIREKAAKPANLKSSKPIAIEDAGNEMLVVPEMSSSQLLQVLTAARESVVEREPVLHQIQQSDLSKSPFKQIHEEPANSITQFGRSDASPAKQVLKDVSTAPNTELGLQQLQAKSFKESESLAITDHPRTSKSTKRKPQLKIKTPLHLPRKSSQESVIFSGEKNLTKFGSKAKSKFVAKGSASLFPAKNPQESDGTFPQKPKKTAADQNPAPSRPKRIRKQNGQLPVAVLISNLGSDSTKAVAGKPTFLDREETHSVGVLPTVAVANLQKDFDLENAPDNHLALPNRATTRKSFDFGQGLSEILDGYFSDPRELSEILPLRDDYKWKTTEEGAFSENRCEPTVEPAATDSSSSATPNPIIFSQNNYGVTIAAYDAQRSLEHLEELTRTPNEDLVQQEMEVDDRPCVLAESISDDQAIHDDNFQCSPQAQEMSSRSFRLLQNNLLATSEEQVLAAQSTKSISAEKRKAVEQFSKDSPKRIRRHESYSEQETNRHAISAHKSVSQDAPSSQQQQHHQNHQRPKSPLAIKQQSTELQGRARQASTILKSVFEGIPSLIDDRLIRKPAIIGFDAKGARNQGGSSTSRAAQSAKKAHNAQDPEIRPRNRISCKNVRVESAVDESYPNSTFDMSDGTSDRPTQRPALQSGLQDGASRSHGKRFCSVPRLQFQRHSGSQGSRVTETGSPQPLHSVAEQHASLKNLKKVLIENCEDGNEPNFEDDSTPTGFGKAKKLLPPTNVLLESHRNHSAVLSSNTKPHLSSPRENQVINVRYIGHKNARRENPVEITMEKMMASQPKLPNPFAEPNPQGILNDFAKRLITERITANRIERVGPRAQQGRASMLLAVEDPEKTLVEDENEYHANEFSSPTDMTSGSSAASRDQTPDAQLGDDGTQTAEQIWLAALRPHYTGVIDSLYQISNYLVLHLQKGHLAAQQLVDDYNDGGRRLVEETEQRHQVERAEVRRGFDHTKWQLRAAYKKERRELENIRQSPSVSVTKLEEDWEQQQMLLGRDLKEAMGHRFEG